MLDTCVIYPAHLRDTLLRLAERGLYRVLWSPDIIEELHRNLVKSGIDKRHVERLAAEMNGAFPDASVTGYASLIEGLTCDPKDRHVLAAAVRANASCIVTFNTIDFPAASVDPFEVEVIDPDTFLLDQLDLAPSVNQGCQRRDMTMSVLPSLKPRRLRADSKGEGGTDDQADEHSPLRFVRGMW